MKKVIGVLLLIVLFTGLSCMHDPCQDNPAKGHYIEILGARANASSSYPEGIEITYLKDKRTGLCFAYVFGTQGFSLTNVPCETVTKFISNIEQPIEGQP